jgi:DNA topoisomerase-1
MKRTKDTPQSETVAHAKRAARRARLRYVTDAGRGITREPHRNGFLYRRPRGRKICDEPTLARIAALAIPPAWTDVWICPYSNGHLQATGRDSRGRKQYRYHPRWRQVRDETKYARMSLFGAVLPQIRRRVRRDLALTGMPREKVLAAVVRLMESTHLRVGNEEYVRQNGSYGLTTLRDRHVSVRGPAVRLVFPGKSGKTGEADLRDERVAKIVRRCRDLPGQKLFQYLDDDGRRRSIDSGDVNEYLREISGQEFTAKDFRTWAGTMWAARSLRLVAPPQTKRETKLRTVEVVRAVADRLGTTEAVCRKSYIHPYVLDAVGDEARLRLFADRARSVPARKASWERFLVRYLRSCERRQAG